MSWFTTTIVAGAVYGAIAIVWTYPLAFRPSQLAAIPYDQSEPSPQETAGGWGPIVRNDQLLSIALPARNAHSLLEGRFGALIDNGLCFPLANAAAFGEHMIEFSLLALPVYALTGDPLLSYNIGCLLEVMLMGMTCFALLRFWTTNVLASFTAGFLFVFHPWRLDLFAHPALVSLHWLPLTLFAFERLLRSASPRAAVLLWVTATLQLLTASYLAITFAVFASVYGTLRLFAERRRVGRGTLALLAASVVATGLAVLPVLLPYVNAQSTWSLVRSGEPTMVTLTGLLPGGAHATGALALVLATLAFVAFRGLIAAPVTAIAAASIVCFLLSARIPGMEAWLGVDSAYALVRGWMPLIEMIRVPGLLRIGGYFGVTLLAGIGLARLLGALRARTRRHVIVAATVVAAVELFYTPATTLIYQATPRVVMRDLRPHPGVLEAYASLEPRASASPILDLPFQYTRVVKGRMAEYVFLSAYHLRPTAACYNSFFGPVYENVGRIAERYWNGGPPDELLALGVHDLVVHDPARWISSLGVRNHVGMTARTNEAIAARVDDIVQTHHDATRLAAGPLELGRAPTPPNDLAVWLQVSNTSDAVWKLPTPPRPTTANITWTPNDASTEPIELQGSILPPLALAAGRTDSVPVAMSRTPPPGEYRLTVVVPDLQWSVDQDVVVPAPHGTSR